MLFITFMTLAEESTATDLYLTHNQNIAKLWTHPSIIEADFKAKNSRKQSTNRRKNQRTKVVTFNVQAKNRKNTYYSA